MKNFVRSFMNDQESISHIFSGFLVRKLLVHLKMRLKIFWCNKIGGKAALKI
jgi:hypothetical protein